MPLNDALVYVPIDSVTRQFLAGYMANLVRSGEYSNAEIIQKAGERFAAGGKLDNYDAPAMLSILRGAQRSVDAARGMESDPGRPGSNVPTIPGDPGYRGQYVYDVIVIATDPASGQRHTDRFEVYSSSPMSASDIQSQIESNRNYYLRQVRSPAPSPGRMDDLTIDTTVIGVGRVA